MLTLTIRISKPDDDDASAVAGTVILTLDDVTMLVDVFDGTRVADALKLDSDNDTDVLPDEDGVAPLSPVDNS